MLMDRLEAASAPRCPHCGGTRLSLIEHRVPHYRRPAPPAVCDSSWSPPTSGDPPHFLLRPTGFHRWPRVALLLDLPALPDPWPGTPSQAEAWLVFRLCEPGGVRLWSTAMIAAVVSPHFSGSTQDTLPC